MMNIVSTGPSQRYLLWLQVSQSFAIQLVMSILYPFLKQNFSFAELSLQSAIQYSAPLFLLPWIRTFWVRGFILFAFAITIIRMLIASHIDTHFELYTAALFASCTLVFFWVPYEILYFRSKTGHGTSSAWYFGAMSLSSVLGPVTAGVIADRFGYPVLFGGAALLMLVPITLALHLPQERIQESLRASLASVAGIRHLIFFDGFFLSVNVCLLSLSLLTFTKTATSFGTVTSVATLIATLVSFAAARSSDQRGDRATWITITSLLSAVLLLALGWQTSFWWFSLLLVAYGCVRTLAQPVLNALPMDLRPDHTKLYIARQFLISSGRVLGFGLTWAFVLVYGLRPMYVVYALGFITYIVCVQRVLKSHRPA